MFIQCFWSIHSSPILLDVADVELAVEDWLVPEAGLSLLPGSKGPPLPKLGSVLCSGIVCIEVLCCICNNNYGSNDYNISALTGIIGRLRLIGGLEPML